MADTSASDAAFKEDMLVHFTAKEEVSFLLALETLSEVTESEATGLDQVAAYQGFDPRTTLKRFYELSQKSPCPPGEIFMKADGTPDENKTYSIEYALEDGTSKYWWIPRLGHFRLDLLFFVDLYATRGTDITKIGLRSTSEMAAIIQEKAKTYQIKGKRTRAKKNQECTCSRGCG